MDVFYFNSPPDLARGSDEEKLKWRRNLLATKRRKICSSMDASPYFANVVRVPEPATYANEPASPLPQYLDDVLFNAGLDLPSAILRPASQDPTGTGYLSTVKLNERQQDSQSPAEDQVPPPPAHENLNPSPSSAYHPRPESFDLLEEEDGRRIRFAFPDETDDHVERLRRSYDSSNRTSPDGRPRLATQLFENEEQPLRSSRTFHRLSNASANLVHIGRLNAWNEQYSFPVPPPPPLPFYTASQLLRDDDVLAVDDEKRNYDFTEFMDDWRRSTSLDDHVPSFTPETGPSLWRRPLNKFVRAESLNGAAADTQGLDWESFGVDRESALAARRILHSQSASGKLSNQQHHDGEGLHYIFQSFAPSHRARPGHYQLRNMVAARDRGSIYYAAGSKVAQASSSCPSTTKIIMDLERPSHSATPFKVTSLTTSVSDSTIGIQQDDSVLIAGGFNGEYAILDLNAPARSRPNQGTVSHARDGIVNHISTFRDRQSGSLRAAFCSNDRSVRLMDVRKRFFTSTFEYESALNCSALSPDSRLRLLGQDGSEALITNAESGEILVKLEAHTDFVFACDWSPCSRYVATGAEDQQTTVWDARNWKRPLQKLDSVMSCPRSLHFTDDGRLVIAESEDVVSIVDTRNFASRQDVRFFGSIAGVSVVNGGEEIVVANSDQTVGGLMILRRVSQGRGVSGCIGRIGGGSYRALGIRESSAMDDVVI